MSKNARMQLRTGARYMMIVGVVCAGVKLVLLANTALTGDWREALQYIEALVLFACIWYLMAFTAERRIREESDWGMAVAGYTAYTRESAGREPTTEELLASARGYLPAEEDLNMQKQMYAVSIARKAIQELGDELRAQYIAGARAANPLPPPRITTKRENENACDG